MLSTIIIFLVLLSLLVLVHEAGHFLTARWTGMKVEEFGIGFPPRLFSWRRGGTRYSINAVPIGGFVKIKGETGEDRSDPEAFVSKSASKRALVLSAGVIMNIVAAWFLLTIGFVAGLPQVVDETVPKAATVRQEYVQIYSVWPDSPAARAGLEVGDRLIALGAESPATAEEAQQIIGEAAAAAIGLTIQRDQDLLTYELTAESVAGIEDRPVLGVGLVTVGLISYSWYQAPIFAAEATLSLGWQMIRTLFDLIVDFISGEEVMLELSGPVGIAELTGQVAALGLSHLLFFAALLSVNLAILNILPFPALDGGRLLFVLWEKLRGRPVSVRLETVVHNAGFLLLMILILIVTYKDVARLFAGV